MLSTHDLNPHFFNGRECNKKSTGQKSAYANKFQILKLSCLSLDVSNPEQAVDFQLSFACFSIQWVWENSNIHKMLDIFCLLQGLYNNQGVKLPDILVIYII